MEQQSQLVELLESLLTQVPSLVTLLVGIVVAFLRWRRHPGVSLVLAAGLIWMLIHLFVFSVVYTFLPNIVSSSVIFLRPSLDFIYTAVGFSFNLLLAVGLALLLIAIFVRRTPPVQVPLT